MSSLALLLADSGAAQPSATRKRFNKLIKELERERGLLTGWQETLPQIEQMMERELPPLAQSYDENRRQMVLLFDQAYHHKSIGVRNKEKLADLIISIAANLLEQGDNPELEALLERYCKPDDEGGLGEPFPALWLDLPDGGPGDAALEEALLADLQEEMERLMGTAPAQARNTKPKPPGKREQRLAAEQEKIQQSVREIYRKLASTLHPDREPDPEERARKTALMQQVNVAYQKNDLLGLLELQLQIEQIDQAGLNALSDERIGRFNTVLSRQVNELQRDVFQIEHMFCVQWDYWQSRRVTPQAAMRKVQDEIEQMRRLVTDSARDLASWTDMKQLKAWLKTYRIPKAETDWYF